MDAYQRVPRLHWAAVAGALIALATDVVYLVAIWNESTDVPPEFAEAIRAATGGPFEPAVVGVAATIAAAAIGSVAAPLIRNPRAARSVSIASVVALFLLGVIGLMSIGIGLLVAGAFVLLSTVSLAGEAR